MLPGGNKTDADTGFKITRSIFHIPYVPVRILSMTAT